MMTPVDEWSPGARAALAAGAFAVIAAGVFWFMWGPGSSGSSSAAAVDQTAAQAAPGSGGRGELGLPAAPAGGTAPTVITTAAPTSPSAAAGPSAAGAAGGGDAGSLALVFDQAQLDQAGKVAVAWVSGIASISWDEDQDARSDRLRAYLADPGDVDLNRWLSPSPTFLADLTEQKTVLAADATVDKVLTVARGSVLLQVTLTQTISHAGVEDTAPSTASYVVTLVPQGDTWLVSAMIGASGGDPGYRR